MRCLQPIQVACEPSSSHGRNTVNNTRVQKYNVNGTSFITTSSSGGTTCSCVLYDINATGVSSSLNAFSENAI